MNRRDFLTLAALAGVPSRAQQMPSPEADFNGVMRDTGLTKKGENFCWPAAYHIHRFLRAYQAWHDTSWLDWGVRYYEFILSKLLTGPDGYKGWIGPYEYDPSVWCDVHVGDAILCNGLVAFAEVVLADSKLSERYGAQAHRYVELASKHLFEKWDARGTWHEDGPYGAYRQWNRYAEPGNLTQSWAVRDDLRGSNLAHPFNKQDDVAAVALKLYRITGEERFRDRAARIFSYQKSRLRLIDDHYAWNYWEPYAASDVDLPAHKCRHWVGPHPDRPYQQGEVANMVEAYRTGIVFDETDMRRIINTNLRVMWNGSLDAPAYLNSNGTKSTAGVLSSALEDFDETIRKLHTGNLAKSRGSDRSIEKAYFENVTQRRPVGFERQLLKDAAKVFEFPMASCPGIILAAALPATCSTKEGTLLTSETLEKGVIEIAQYSADGKRKMATLHQADQQWFLIHRWAGMEPGAYRIRWTFAGGGYREAPVVCTARPAVPGNS